MVRLEDAFGKTKGELLVRVLDLEFALQTGIVLTLDDITAEEFAVLKMLTHERNRWEKEQQDNHARS